MPLSAMAVLHGAASSLIVECPDRAPPVWRYWGPRLPEGALPPPLAGARAPASFSLDLDQPLGLLPSFGGGWFGQSALLAHREGRHFVAGFGRCEVERRPDNTLRFTLRDAVAQLTVRVCLALDPATDVLLASTEIVNDGQDVLDVPWLAACVLPLPGEALAVHATTGRHTDEFRPLVTPLGRAGWRRENRRGITSHDAFPGAVVILPGTTESAGTAYAAQLAWSGNHLSFIDWVDDGRYQWQLGEWLAPGELRLAPGACHATPEVLAVCSTAGLDGASQRLHAAARGRIDWPGGAMRPRPVTVNTWEGFYFDHDPDRLRPLVRRAAQVGAERFVLDDGWFHGRRDDRTSLGDWWPDEARYPRGLGPLIAEVEAHGMAFGLWVEPEMVSPDSELMRAHPDWALGGGDGRPQLTGRNQLVLDLSRPDVAEHLFASLSALLRAHPIGTLKWDHNRDLAPATGPDGRARYHAQVTAAYGLLSRLRDTFPHLEIESCAGGGGRVDAGVLRHVHRFWTSDNIDARSRLATQRGFLRWFPPEVMGAHIGAAPAHVTGRSQSLAFRAAVALPGHLGLELDLASLDDAQLAAVAGWVALHKRLRPLLHGGIVWQGEGQDSLLWQAHAAMPGGAVVLFAYRLDPPAFRHPSPLPLPFLLAHGEGAAWRVTALAPDREPPHAGLPEGIFANAVLGRIGLPMPNLGAEQAAILHLEPGA